MTTATLAPPKKGAKPGLGTFAGVYLPSVLTIFGVIMYLRLGQVVGSVGLISSLTIILLASSITLFTALSIATSSTNMKVEGGGAYFLISRAFGKEIGTAVGLPLYLAQAIGIAFYVSGFVESVSAIAPGISPQIIGVSTLALLTALAFTSASLAMKAQGFIFLAIVLSLTSFFTGYEVAPATEIISMPKLGFWAAFSLFFPAVTGIEAGVSMSGDLRDPSKSLVRGVVLAVLTGLVVYLVMAWWLWANVGRGQLLSDPFIVQHMARWGWMIIMGLWGATLSSSLGALMGAPRTLQALAQDGVMPRFLAKGFGPMNEPRIATLFTFLASGACIYFGRINLIAPLLTMFFLLSYGMLNLAAGIEGFVQNPSWRPTFQVPAIVSLLGAAMCVMTMLLINPGASFVAFFLVTVVYLIAVRRSMTKGWDDIRQGMLLVLARLALYRLAKAKVSARSWRPNFLVFTNGYYASQRLLDFTSQITRGKGLLVLAPIFRKNGEDLDLELATKRFVGICKLRKVKALVAVSEDERPVDAMVSLAQSCGLGAMRPNTLVVGDAASNSDKSGIIELAYLSQRARKSLVVLVGEEEKEVTDDDGKEEALQSIDIWWDDESKENSELMLVLAHMHQSSKGSAQVKINVKCTVPNESAREHRQEFFDTLFNKTRFRVSTQVYVEDDKEEARKLRGHFSQEASLVLCGMRPPQKDELQEDYLAYYREGLKKDRKLRNVAYVLSAETVDLTELLT